MVVHFRSQVIEWRGPAPYLFAPLPPEAAEEVRSIAKAATYGWGCLPAIVRIGATSCTTSLFPKDGTYLVPIKVALQKAERVGLGDVVDVELRIGREL